MSPYRPHNVVRAFGTHWGLDLPDGLDGTSNQSGKSLLYFVSSLGLDMSVQSRSLSNSGREETPGADQARRLTPSTEADWGGRSLGGPGGAGARPFGGGRRCSKHASGAQ